ncbi:DUF1700 domain-containing protein [Luteibacter sp. PPL201]|uniref:DUF1700 domain-containing protein n=1 Tax=Luteibacter sahnii TaxID=3021977 RepID=A0ABT6BAF0_9GAMM
MTPNNAVTTRVWLRRLRWSLNALPRADRDDITCEIESHISDRIAQGMIEEHVLAALGPPELYARAFLDDFELNGALANQGLLAMCKVALHRITRSLAAFVGVVAAGCLGIMAMAIILTVVMRFIDPVHWGLWLTAHSLTLGVVDSPSEGRELLGAWLYAWAVIWLILCWTLGKAVLLTSLRHIAKSTSLPAVNP